MVSPGAMHHKRKRPKQRRAGCLLCKPSKLNANKTAARMVAYLVDRGVDGASVLEIGGGVGVISLATPTTPNKP